MNYNDIRELLMSKKQDGLTGRGASEVEICRVEEELRLHFPSSYREFLKEHGWGYFGSLEAIGGIGADIPEEWDRGVNILRIVVDERNGPIGMPLTVIPFYQNGAGDWYALDCSVNVDKESPVVFISHEQAATLGFSFVRCADSFSDWIYSRLSNISLDSQ